MLTPHMCQAEIGKPGNWHTCDRKAAWHIQSATGSIAFYCDKHKAIRAGQITRQDYSSMRAAPFAEWHPV